MIIGWNGGNYTGIGMKTDVVTASDMKWWQHAWELTKLELATASVRVGKGYIYCLGCKHLK